MRYARNYIGNSNMDIIVISLLWELQQGLCAVSKEPLRNFQLHHKRYGMNITIYDLDLRNMEHHTHGKNGASGVGRNICAL